MFYYKIARKAIKIIGTEEKVEKVGNHFDDSSIKKVYKLASKIASMGYNLDLVENEIGVGLKIYISPDEIGEVLRTVRSVKQC